MVEEREVISEADAIEAWHFLPADGRIRYGARETVEVGKAISVEPPLSLCNRGLHASIRPRDALVYAPGPIVCRVKVWGEIVRSADKLCGQSRVVLWMADATKDLHRFACDVATEALDLVESGGCKVDRRSREAIRVKLRWLDGQATDKELDAAACAADRGAECAAGCAAGRCAVRAAVWSADRSATCAAAWSAAWSADCAADCAARDVQNRRLCDLFMALAPKEESCD